MRITFVFILFGLLLFPTAFTKNSTISKFIEGIQKNSKNHNSMNHSGKIELFRHVKRSRNASRDAKESDLELFGLNTFTFEEIAKESDLGLLRLKETGIRRYIEPY